MSKDDAAQNDKKQCERRYRIGMKRDEPFEVTYRCGREAGHDGACGAGDGEPFVISSAERTPAEIQLRAWQEVFGTTQLTHAKARLDAAEAKAVRSPVAPSRCPTCNGPDPALHPAVQAGGEVQLCRDPWHKPTADEIEAKERAERSSVAPGMRERAVESFVQQERRMRDGEFIGYEAGLLSMLRAAIKEADALAARSATPSRKEGQ